MYYVCINTYIYIYVYLGERGGGLHYLNSLFHRIIPGFMVQGIYREREREGNIYEKNYI